MLKRPRRARYLLAKVQNTLTCIKLPSKLMRDASAALCLCAMRMPMGGPRVPRYAYMRYGILRRESETCESTGVV